MPTGKPREPVKRIAREGDDVVSADGDLDLTDGGSGSGASDKAAGTKSRAAQAATKDTTTSKDTKAAAKASAKEAKASRRGNKRVTPKGTTPSANTRYTPPTARYEDMPSPLWVPILMFTLFGLGMLSIFLNYVGLLPGATSNWYLLLGLGFILAGIITATQYR